MEYKYLYVNLVLQINVQTDQIVSVKFDGLTIMIKTFIE